MNGYNLFLESIGNRGYIQDILTLEVFDKYMNQLLKTNSFSVALIEGSKKNFDEEKLKELETNLRKFISNIADKIYEISEKKGAPVDEWFIHYLDTLAYKKDVKEILEDLKKHGITEKRINKWAEKLKNAKTGEEIEKLTIEIYNELYTKWSSKRISKMFSYVLNTIIFITYIEVLAVIYSILIHGVYNLSLLIFLILLASAMTLYYYYLARYRSIDKADKEFSKTIAKVVKFTIKILTIVTKLFKFLIDLASRNIDKFFKFILNLGRFILFVGISAPVSMLKRFLKAIGFTGKILNEVAVDDFDKGRVIQLKPGSYEWYMGKSADAIRHTKVLFKSHNLQKQICKEYINHDPTKNKTGCIEVLLCKPNIKGYENKWVAISTLRKLNPECLIKYPETYAYVPNDVLRRALANLKDKVKTETFKAAIKLFLKNLKSDSSFRAEMIKKHLKDKPILVNSKEDFVKKVLLKEK